MATDLFDELAADAPAPDLFDKLAAEPDLFDQLASPDPKEAKIAALRAELGRTRDERSNAATRLGALSDYVVGPVANIFNTAANLPFLASRAVGLVPPEQEPPMSPGESFVPPELLSAPAETALERLGYIRPEHAGPSVARGVIRGGSHLVSGLATPENIPFLGVGAVRPVLQAATGAGFSALMASQLPEATEQFAESTVTGTPQDIAEKATTLSGLFAMTGAPVVLPPALKAIGDRRIQRAENNRFDRASAEWGRETALELTDSRRGRNVNAPLTTPELPLIVEQTAAQAATSKPYVPPVPETPPIVSRVEPTVPQTAPNVSATTETVPKPAGPAKPSEPLTGEALTQAFRERLDSMDNETMADAFRKIGFERDESTGQYYSLDSNGNRHDWTVEDWTGDRLSQYKQEFLDLTAPKQKFVPATESPMIGMGAMIQGELIPAPRPPTSNKNAVVDAERAQRGLPPIEPVMRQTWGVALDEAMARIEADPQWQDRLIEELRSKSRSTTAVENAALLQRRVDLSNELEKAMREGVQAVEDGRLEDAALAEVRTSEWSDKLSKLEEATERAGTELGRGLAARKQMMAEDFSLTAMELKKRSENGFRQLTRDEHAELVRTYNELEATRKAADEAAAAAQTRIVTAEAARALAELERDAARKPLFHPRILEQAERIAKGFENRADAARARLRGKLAGFHEGVDPTILLDVAEIGAGHLARAVVDFGKWSEVMIRDLGEGVRPYLEAGWAAANKIFEEGTSQAPPKVKAAIKRTADAATTKTTTVAAIKSKLDGGDTAGITSLVQKLARSLVESGVRGRDALIDAVHAELITIDPTFTRRDTMDAISGYGKFKQLTKDEVSVALRDLKGQMQQVAKLEDLESRKPPLKTGVERRVPSEEERRLIKAVNELKRKYGIATTDPATQLKSSLDSRKTYYRNQIADLERQITSKTKDAPGTPPPTDPELVGLKERREQLKKEFDEIFDPKLTDEQIEAKALEVEARALRKRIAEQERMLATGELVAPGRPINRPAHPVLEALKQERDALNAQIAEARKKPAEQREAEALARKIEALNKRIAAAEAKVAAGDLSTTSRPVNRPSLPGLEQARQRLEAINVELNALRKAARPPVDVDARALAALKSRLARSTAELEARLAAGDFAKRPRRRVVEDTEAIRARMKHEDVQNRFNKGLYEDRMRRRTRAKKIWDGIKRTVGIPIHLVSSFDFSAPRQLLFAILSNTTRIVTHPHRTMALMGRPFGRMFTGAWSESHAKFLEAKRNARPNAESGADKIGKLELTSLDDTKFTPREERAHSVLDEWAALPFKTGNRAKSVVTAPFKVVARGVRFSNRAFVTALNETRVALYDELLRVNYKDRPPADVDLQIVGNLVNVATGRGKLNPSLAKVGSWFLWSPKLLASRIQTLTGQPLLTGQWAGSARARKIVAKEYARMLIAGYALYKVSRLFSDDEDVDITSSDAGKIVRGNTRIDLWGGYQQVTVIGARTGYAVTTSLRGRESSLGPDRKWGERGIWYVWADFARGKARPELAAAIDIITRETGPKRVQTTPATVAENLLVPLPMRDIKGIMREHGYSEALILQILSEFGAGVSNYEEVERQR